jgi:hypothetical protein
MAALYKDLLIIPIGQFDKDRELWMPMADKPRLHHWPLSPTP